MTHQRQNIRDAVVTLLTNASIVATGKVYSNRNLPVLAGALPVIVVYTLPEQSTDEDMTSGRLRRTLDVNVEVMASNANDELTDNTVDDLAYQVEAALKADQSWGGVVTESTLVATEIIKDDNGGDASIGVLHMKYQAIYFY